MEKLYRYSEAAEILGIKVKTLVNNIASHKDKIQKIYVSEHNKPMLNQDAVDFLMSIKRAKKSNHKKDSKPKKKDSKPKTSHVYKKSKFFKVSVFDNNLGLFIVKHVCLSYCSAKIKVMEYIEKGLIARLSSH